MKKEDTLSIVYEGISGEDSILIGMRGGEGLDTGKL